MRIKLPAFMRRDGRTVNVALTCDHTINTCEEKGMSDCAHGCKVFHCKCGSLAQVIHNEWYGCREWYPGEVYVVRETRTVDMNALSRIMGN